MFAKVLASRIGVSSFVRKENPYHDATGAFTSKDKASGGLLSKLPADDASHKEWEDFLKTSFPETRFRISHMSLGLLKDFAKQYASLAEKYPWAAANVDDVGMFNPDYEDSPALAYVEQSIVKGSTKDMLRFDAWRFSDDRLVGGMKNPVGVPDSEKEVRADLQHSERTRFAPEACGTIPALISHEFGHIIDGVLSEWRLSGGPLSKEWMVDKEDMSMRTKWDGVSNFKESLSKLLKQPSDYAKKNNKEMFAEAFTESIHNPYFSDKSLKVSPRNETVTANVKKMLNWYTEWKTTGVRPTRGKDWLPTEVKP